MTLYAMVVEDHEVRLFPLDNVDVLDIPDEDDDFAHAMADNGDSDLLAQCYLPSEDFNAQITRMGAIVPVRVQTAPTKEVRG